MKKIKTFLLLIIALSFTIALSACSLSGNSYSISYVLNGGNNSISNVSVYNKGDTLVFDDASKKGHSFEGWFLDEDFTTQCSGITSTDTGNKTLYAKFRAITYSLTYDLVGGSGDYPAEYNVDTESFSLAQPTKTGYTFTGWTGTDITFKTKSLQIPKGSSGNRSYTANWSATNYTITYNLNGGNVSGNKTSYTIETTAFTLNNPTRTGYTFTGWTGTGLSIKTMSVEISSGSSGNRAYTANWTINSYTFSYSVNDSNMGSIACATASGTVLNYGTSILLSAQPSTGYQFVSWTKGGNAVSLSNSYSLTMPDNSLTLVANFEAIPSGGIEYNKNSNADFVYTTSIETATAIANVYGAGINIHTDNIKKNASVSGKQLTITKEYLQSLPIGSYDVMLSTTDSSSTVINEVIQIDIVNTNPKPYNIRFDYDSLANSFVLLEFDCDCSHNDCSYSWNDGDYITAGNENILPYYNKFASNTVTVRCNTCGTSTTYTKVAAPATANDYLGATFSLLGKTYDKYIESFEEYIAFLKYLVFSNSTTAATESSITGKCYLEDNFYSTFDTSMNNETLFAALGEFNMSNFCRTYWYSDDIVSQVYSITFTFKQDSTDSDKISSGYTTTSQETREVPVGNRSATFDNFPINSWDKSIQINSLYELDELPYGVKPTFTSGSYAETIYNIALDICKTYISDDMTDRQKVTVFYDWLAKNTCYDMATYKMSTLTSNIKNSADTTAAISAIDSYLATYPCMTTILTPLKSLSTKDKMYLASMDIETRMTAYTMDGALRDGTAVCDGYASAFKILCLIEGINCTECFGLAGGGGHAWNKVYVDNKWYCVDVTWAVQNIGTFHYYLFMTDDQLNQENHEETNPGLDYRYSETLATGDNNYFYGYIIDSANNYDLVADSRAELEAIIDYYIDECGYSRFEFIINYSIGTINNVVGDILEEKYGKLFISVSGGTFVGMGDYCYVYFNPADAT